MCYLKFLIGFIFILGSIVSADTPAFDEGIKAETEQRWTDAISIYENILKKNPERSDLCVKIADIKNHLKDHAGAAKAIEQAIAVKPQASLYFHLSQDYATINQPQKAYAAIQEAVKREPNNIEYLTSSGILANWAGDTQRAKKDFYSVLNKDPKNHDALLGISRTYINDNQFKIASAFYQQFLQFYPKEKDIWLEYAKVLRSNEQFEKSFKALKNYKQLGGNQQDYLAEKNQLLLNAGANVEKKNRWDLAAALYETGVEEQPNNANLWIKVAESKSQLKDYSGAARAHMHLINLEPKNPKRYVDLSTTYALADKPKDALLAINSAVKLSPKNIHYLNTQAILANWSNELETAEESYEKILSLDPNNQDALLQLSRVESARNKLGVSDQLYKRYLRNNPHAWATWLELAKVQNWEGDYVGAHQSFEIYRRAKGETKEYRTDVSRFYATAGLPMHSMAVIEPLLDQSPDEYELLYTEALALRSNNDYSNALTAYGTLNSLYPSNSGNKGLFDSIKTPVRSSITLNPYYSHDNDSIDIFNTKLYGQYYLNAATYLLYHFKYEILSAPLSSGFATVDNHTSIQDAHQLFGINHILFPVLNVGAQAGIGEIQRNESFFLYEVNADIRPFDEADILLQHGRALYTVSPRSVSLEIKDFYNRARLTWDPKIYPFYFIATGEFDIFSDGNHGWSSTFSPRYKIFRTQYWNWDVGLEGNWLGFSKNLISNGYYSPKFYNSYEVVSYLYYKQSANINYSLITGAGFQKDNMMQHTTFAGDISFQAIFGIVKDWQLVAAVTASDRQDIGGNYKVFSAQLALTRRF